MSVINPKFNAPEGPVWAGLRARRVLLSASTDYRRTPIRTRGAARYKVIFRCTPQWFVPRMAYCSSHPDNWVEQRWENEGGAQELVDARYSSPLTALDETKFYPREGAQPDRLDGRGAARLGAQPPARLGRCRSRCSSSARPAERYMADFEVNARIAAAVKREGADAWKDAERARRCLGNAYDAADYETRITDILDVWYRSADRTHAFVLDPGRLA